MLIFPSKTKSKTHPVEEKNLRQRTREFLETTDQFLKTTTGTITSLTLLLGATSSLGLVIGLRIPDKLPENGLEFIAKDTCSNESLSTKHFREQPLKTSPYEIKTRDVSVDMEISVYKNGDILTIYGETRKRLCFPEVKIDRVADSLVNFLIPPAVAQTTVPNVRERTTYIQEQTLSPNNSQIIEQTRIYSDGTVEKTQINRKTGIIFDKTVSTTTITPELQERLDRGVEVEETTIIDVRPK